MSSIEIELWNIFTYYTLHSNPKDPSRINNSALYKFCKDIMVLDPSMTEKPLTQAELHIIFASELRNQKKAKGSSDKSDRICYDEFLSCLMRIATKCYPSNDTYEEAMQQLLMDNVLPLASRRVIVDLSSLSSEASVQSVIDYYQESLSEIFGYYATASDQSKNRLKAERKSKSFDDYKNHFEVMKQNQNGLLVTQMGYADFIRFAVDFGFTSSMGLTCLDLGDIYLVVIAMKKIETTVRKIDLKEFGEVLVRCAIVAFQSYTDITTEDKVKGMFLYIWRHIQATVQEQVSNKGTVVSSTTKGGLLKGAQVLNERFLLLWAKDQHRDYLNTPPPPPPANVSMIQKLLEVSGQNSILNQDATNGSMNESVLPATPLVSSCHGAANSSRMDMSVLGSKSVVIDLMDVQAQQLRDDSARANVLVDDRISVSKLKRLLQVRPDITKLLSDCMIENNIGV